MKKKFLLLVATFGVAITAASFNFGVHQASATVPGNNTLVSYASSATTAVGGGHPLMSADGKFYAFVSDNTSIVPNDTNNKTDAFLRNLETGAVERVTVSTSGAQINSSFTLYDISATGRYITFQSMATNLIDGATISTSYPQLYLRDTVTDTTTLLSKNPTTGDPGNGAHGSYGISSDGRFVLVNTDSTNLGTTVTNTFKGYNLFLLDRQDGSFKMVNDRTDGVQPERTSFQFDADMSCDGSLIVFTDIANLIAGTSDPGGVDVYLLDLRNGEKLSNITHNAGGEGITPRISCNGDYITLQSPSASLDTSVSIGGYFCTFLYSRVSGTFKMIDKSTSGTVSNQYNSSFPSPTRERGSVSDTGVVAFESSATNLTGISVSGRQIYLYNPTTDTTELLSQYSGVAANASSQLPSISYDGRKASFGTAATNMASITDTNGYEDAFVAQTGL